MHAKARPLQLPTIPIIPILPPLVHNLSHPPFVNKMGPQSLFNPPPSSSSPSSTTAYKPNATAGPSSESHFKRRAESPTHSQAVTQAQIQGIDISSSEHGISSWSSNLNNNAIKEGKGKEPMRPGFRIITHELIPISNTATPSTTNSLSPGNTYLTGTSSTTTEDQTANQTDFLDSHASDGRTLCVRHQMMADQGVNGKLQKVGVLEESARDMCDIEC